VPAPNTKDAAPRESVRVPLETKVNLEFEKFTGFITEYSSNISDGGMFIKTHEPRPVGTILSFDFRLRDNFKLIQGLGEVAWVRQIDAAPDKPAGMGIKFHDIDEPSRELIKTMVSHHVKSGGAPFNVDDFIRETANPTPLIPAKGPATVEEDFKALFEAADPFQQTPSVSPDVAAPSPPPAQKPEPPSSPAPPATTSPRPPTARTPAVATSTPKPTKRLGIVIEDESVLGDEPILKTTIRPAEDLQPSRSRAWLLVLAGLLLMGVGGAAFVFKEKLTTPKVATPDEAAMKTPPATHPNPAPTAETKVFVPPAATPSPAAAVETVKIEPHVSKITAPEAKTVVAPRPANGLSIVENITGQQVGDETILTVWGNGDFSTERYSHLRVGGPKAREVIKIGGIRQAYPKSTLALKSAHVRQVRTGYHAEGGGELHIVLDLLTPQVTLSKIVSHGSKLQVHLTK